MNTSSIQGPMDNFMKQGNVLPHNHPINQEQIKIERKFVNLNGVSKHLFCTICQEVFDDAKRINCGHTFCNNCIIEWIKKNSRCPICRQQCTNIDLSKDLIASNIIGDLEVTCINKGSHIQVFNFH